MINKIGIYFTIFIISFGSLSNCEETTTLRDETIQSPTQYNISLWSYVKRDFGAQEFTRQDIIPEGRDITFSVTDIPDVVSFVIFQVHAFENNVTISYNDNVTLLPNNSISGSNIGLFYDTKGKGSINIYVRNSNNKSVEALFVVVAYRSDAPVPGGCNMEFDLEISPFQKVFVTNSMIIVDAQLSSEPKNQTVKCDKNLVQHDAYHMYLPAHDFTSDTYFTYIRKLLTPENIIRNGEKIPKSLIGSSMRRVYSAYPGVGSVFAMVATYKNQSAAYVPSFTYACSDSLDECGSMLGDGVSKTVNVLMIFLGVYFMLFGHSTPNGSNFLFAWLGGGLIGYILAVVAGTQSSSDIMWISIGSGFLIASIWNIFLCCCCRGLIRIAPNMLLAFFFSCVTYYRLPDKAVPLENDFYFWAFFCSVTLLLFVLISITSCFSSIFCCSILGSYLLIVAIDYYIGSSFKYIIINVIRRITISGFDVAVVNPPYGSQEVTLTVFWVIFALISFLIQLNAFKGLYKIRCCRMRGDDLTIPLAHRNCDGSVNFTPWADIFKASRNLRRQYR